MKSFTYRLNLSSFESIKLGGALAGLGLLERIYGYGIKDDTEEEEEEKGLLFNTLSPISWFEFSHCRRMWRIRGEV